MAKKGDTSKTRTKPKTQVFLPLRYQLLSLAFLVFLVYAGSLGFGFTKLDDTIFVEDYRAYNEDISNLFTSFTRGVFHETNDTYYRPFFLNAMILNYQFSGLSPAGYHAVNVLLHLLVVILLYRFLTLIGIRDIHALLLSALYAIHPVLVQNVVWIPGRNDTLLAAFTLLFLHQSVVYSRTIKTRALVMSVLWLVCAFFTKETAVFVPVAAFLIATLMLGTRWNAKSQYIQYGTWAAVFLLWYFARNAAITSTSSLHPAELVSNLLERLPLLVQYLGKIFLPVNLSVFPIMEDTVYLYGIVSIALLGAILLTAKEKDWRTIVAGVFIFLSFLVPVFLVPKTINTQTFEHRLYLPMIGMLLILSQSVLIRNTLKEKTLFIAWGAALLVLVALNLRHQRHFKDEITFWTQATETSPHSAYAWMMLGAKLPDPDEGALLFRKAYALDSTEKYINYYYGAMLQYQDSVPESEPYLLVEKERSDYVEVDYLLARVAFEKGDFQRGISYLERFLERSPMHEAGNSNLLRLYLQSGDHARARAHAQKMERQGLMVPPDIKGMLTQ